MAELLSLLTGCLLAGMVQLNGELSQGYGVWAGAVLIHAVGAAFALVLCAVLGRWAPRRRLPGWMYLGGVVGVLTVVFSAAAYTELGVTCVVAFSLAGQMASAALVDAFGLFGMPKRPLSPGGGAGFVLALAGAALLAWPAGGAPFAGGAGAAAAAFGSGISIVVSRMLNARLALETGALPASLINHLAGLPVCLAAAGAAAALGAGLPDAAGTPWQAYLGGMLGVVAVMLTNYCVPRSPAFRLTLCTFCAQLFCGLALDAAAQGLPGKSLAGGALAAAGAALSLLPARPRRKAPVPDRPRP